MEEDLVYSEIPMHVVGTGGLRTVELIYVIYNGYLVFTAAFHWMVLYIVWTSYSNMECK